MSEKQHMDDFASLFLPDLLNPLDALQNDDRKNDTAAGPHVHASPGISTSSSGMSLIRFFEASQATGPDDAGALASAFSDVNQYLESPQVPKFHSHMSTPAASAMNLAHLSRGGFGGSATSLGGAVEGAAAQNSTYNPTMGLTMGHNMGHNMGYSMPHNVPLNLGHSSQSMAHSAPSPFSGLDMGHAQHYGDFGPESQRPYMAPHVTHDNNWASSADPAAAALAKSWLQPSAGVYYSGCAPNAMDAYAPDYYNPQWAGARLKKEDKSDHEKESRKRRRDKVPGPSPMSGSSTPPITVDYSGEALDQLVDMKRTSREPGPMVTSPNGPVTFSLRGFLNGRLLSNDQDNYNYICVSAGSVDPAQVYRPQVISCYRRNFINLHLHLSVDYPSTEMAVLGEPIRRLRVEISAITDKTDPKPVPLLDNEFEPDAKDMRKSDAVSVETIGPSHVLELSECKKEAFWKVKKLQFKSATANSTNLAFQTYYRFVARVVAETDSGDRVIEELVSNPIIVRGRNPSFYQQKNDILIKAKSPNIASSYSYSALALPLLPEEFSGENKPSDVPTMASLDSASVDTGEHMAVKSEDTSPDFMGNTVLAEEKKEKEVESDRGNGHGNANNTEHASSHAPPGEDVKATESKETKEAKEDNRVSRVPSAGDLRRILDAMSEKKDGKYHYFPISNVYYLPPINVVYFPHAAHHTETEGEGVEAKADTDTHTPASHTSERKASSKMYFR